MPLARTIDVVAPHALSQEKAWERLLNIRQSVESGSWLKADVKLLEIHGYPEKYELLAKIKVTAMTQSVTHTLTFKVNPKDIRVTSDPADEPWEALEMWGEGRELEAMLREAMK